MTFEEFIEKQDEIYEKQLQSLTTREEHAKSFKNFDAIKQSKKCGCCYCEKIFDATEVDEWITEGDGQKTALCPYCGIDSVVQDFNVNITPELLAKMNEEWFGGSESEENWED